jgi:hypothetical protein
LENVGARDRIFEDHLLKKMVYSNFLVVCVVGRGPLSANTNSTRGRITR